MSCSGGNGVGPDSVDNKPSADEDGLVTRYCRDACWDAGDWDYNGDYEVEGSDAFDSKHVDISDVRLYPLNQWWPWAGDINRHSGSPHILNESAVIYAWTSHDGAQGNRVKWRVRYYDDDDNQMHFGDVQIVPGHLTYAQTYPAITCYMNWDPNDEEHGLNRYTVDIVFKRNVSGQQKIYHFRYRQDTTANYDDWSLDDTLHPTGNPVLVSDNDDFHCDHPDVVWWGAYEGGRESHLFCVWEHFQDSTGSKGNRAIRFARYDEGDSAWEDHDWVDNSSALEIPMYPRIDVGHLEDLNDDDWTVAVVWHSKQYNAQSQVIDYDVIANYWDAAGSPDYTDAIVLGYSGFDSHYDMFPMIDFDLPRNSPHLAHIVWTYFTSGSSYPTNMYWNTDMWSGGLPAPDTFNNLGGIYNDDGLTTIAVAPDDGLNTYDKAYAAWISEDASSDFYVWATEIDFSGAGHNPDPADYVQTTYAIGEGQTNGTGDNTFGPEIACRHADQVHVGWADQDTNGMDDWDIMEDYDSEE